MHVSLNRTKHAVNMIDEALEYGINYFDTADLYDFGLNEEFVGQALKKHRNDIILATKVGNRWNDAKDSWTWDPSKAYIKEEVKESLRRLFKQITSIYINCTEEPLKTILRKRLKHLKN